jgi:hypothetical protein
MPDRFGNPAEPDPPEDATATSAEFHDPRCRSGWIDRDADHPVPCLKCRPNLAADVRRRRMGLGDKK